jgi:hypothetical protein
MTATDTACDVRHDHAVVAVDLDWRRRCLVVLAAHEINRLDGTSLVAEADRDVRGREIERRGD